MAGTTVTTLAKKKMVKARAGISSLPKIVGMAFGDGGVDSGGTVKPHSADQTPCTMNYFARMLMVTRFFLTQKSDIVAHWRKMSWQTLIFLRLDYMMQTEIWWP